MPDRSSSNHKKIDSGIVSKAYDFSIGLLKNHLPETFLFHSDKHMKEVLKYVEIIGNYHHLSEDDMNILKISAIFHDVGYIKKYKGHEEEGIKIARKFLEENQIEEPQIQKVEHAIMATKIPQNPKNLLSKILCDADLINLTYNHYFASAELMRQEWINTGFKKMNEAEFHKNSLKFFESHHFHTGFANKFFKSKKENNYKRIRQRLAEINKAGNYKNS